MELLCHSMAQEGKLKEMCDAIISAHINLPGFAFHRGMLARKKLDHMVLKEIQLRRSGKVEADDLLTVMLSSTDPDSNRPLLEGDALLDNLQILIFAGHETSTSVITWAIYLLSQNPKQLQLLEENEAIRKGKGAGEPLNWQDLSKMTFTVQVGYDIPKGWNIMLDSHAVHHNPDYFRDAQTFDPSRFQVPPKPNTYMAFGIGPRYCLGKDMAMMEFLVFLHHFVLKCKWTILSKDKTSELVLNPMPGPKDGVAIRIEAVKTW